MSFRGWKYFVELCEKRKTDGQGVCIYVKEEMTVQGLSKLRLRLHRCV